MDVWRVGKKRWAQHCLAGEGARQAGGRWTPRGRAVVYTSATLSLAALEYFVHADADTTRSAELVSHRITVPDAPPIRVVADDELPEGWSAVPYGPATQAVGASWLEANAELTLSVPSAVIPEERNYVLSPAHADFRRVRVAETKPFRFDPRVWK